MLGEVQSEVVTAFRAARSKGRSDGHEAVRRIIWPRWQADFCLGSNVAQASGVRCGFAESHCRGTYRKACWHFTFTHDDSKLLLACDRSNNIVIADPNTYKQIGSIEGIFPGAL
jgi:hypothetical protein